MIKGKWEAFDGEFSPAGGRGSVRLFINKETGEKGVVKNLSPSEASNRTRRARMNREVTALKAAEGPGIPKVLGHNTDQWEGSDELYVILEYIEGKTLNQYQGGRPIGLDPAINITLKLASILERVHAQDVRHRDIKPDNIILADSNPDSPYLIDFGLAWSPQDSGEADKGFITEVGEELGNRFLRLPEFSTGSDKRDIRSDITQLAGILLYLSSGSAPRNLTDASGKRPEEALSDDIPAAVKSDARWRKLQRVFRVAFQSALELRYQTTGEFADALKFASASVQVETDFDHAEDIKEKLREEFESSERKKRDEIIRNMKGSHGAFLTSLSMEIGQCNLIHGGSGPDQRGREDKVLSQMFVLRSSTQEPRVSFIHFTEFKNGKVYASWHIENIQSRENYYVGPIADPDSLCESASKAGRECAIACIQEYLKRLKNP